MTENDFRLSAKSALRRAGCRALGWNGRREKPRNGFPVGRRPAGLSSLSPLKTGKASQWVSDWSKAGRGVEFESALILTFNCTGHLPEAVGVGSRAGAARAHLMEIASSADEDAWQRFAQTTLFCTEYLAKSWREQVDNQTNLTNCSQHPSGTISSRRQNNIRKYMYQS